MVYVLLSTFIILSYYLINLIKGINKNFRKIIYTVLISLLLILVIGLRSKNIGTDTPSYVIIFNQARKFTLNNIRYYISSEKEFGFFIFQSFIKSINNSYTFWFISIGLIVIIPISVYIYKYSTLPHISYLLLMSMGYLNFMMAGIRQTIAIGLLIMAVLCIRDKKYILFLAFLLLATTCHRTSIVFILALFITNKPVKIWHIIIVIAMCLILSYYGKEWLANILEYVWGDTRKYSFKENGGYSTLVLFVLIAILALIFDRKSLMFEKDINNFDKSSYKFLLLSIPFQFLAIYQANAFRIAMYFSIFGIMPIISNTLSIQKNKQIRIIGTIITIIALLVQLFAFTYWTSDINPYEFYWQV